MTYFIYNLCLLLTFPAAMLYYAWRLFVSEKARDCWRSNFGGLPRLSDRPCGQKLIWIHAVSVGEFVASLPLQDELRRLIPGVSIYVTTVTRTGNEIALKSTKDAESIGYLPLDYTFILNRAFNRLRPDALVLMEAEIWPNLLETAKRRGIPVILANGRISDKAIRRGRAWRWLVSWAYANIDECCMQTELDAERIRELGARPDAVHVFGNTKFDQEGSQLPDDAVRALRADLGLLNGEQVFVAGSTNPGEDEPILDAFVRMKERLPNLRLIVAPRQIERADEIQGLAEKRGLKCSRRSAGETFAAESDVLVLDTFGELARIYAAGDITFVGGTLVAKGGHSLIQPILQGKPVFYGPHTFKTRDVARTAIAAGVGFEIAGTDELASQGEELLANAGRRAEIDAACRKLVAENQGASQRCGELIARMLSTEIGEADRARLDRRTAFSIPRPRRRVAHPSPGLVRFLESVLYGDRADISAVVARGFLRSLTPAYRVLLGASRTPFDLGIRKRHKLSRPVVSVGNLTVGGTGKSPTVQYLCRGLARTGLHPAVLSYGYAGELHGKFGIVSDSSEIRLTPDEAGDEPVMLARSLPGTPVLVGRDRATSGRVAIDDLGADVLVLDDGFQVWNLERDLDIVLINSFRPFDNGRTLPAGRLREPLPALKRANCIIATGQWNTNDSHAMAETVRRYTSAPIFYGRFVPSAIVPLADGREMPIDLVEGKRVFALSSIASPRSFEESLAEAGAVVVGRERLPDHHFYTPRDLARVGRKAVESGAELIATTDKDGVKLDQGGLTLPTLILRIALRLEDEDGFWDLVWRKVTRG